MAMTLAEDTKTLVLIFLVLVFFIVIPYILVKIIKSRGDGESTTLGSSNPLIDVDIQGRPRKTIMSTAASSNDRDDVFNMISSTKAIASELKMNGVDTYLADNLLSEAEISFQKGSYHDAMIKSQTAKDILLNLKAKDEDEDIMDPFPKRLKEKNDTTLPKKTMNLEDDAEGVSTKAKDLIDEKEMKKPDNYLPSKFTISMAERAIESARNSGISVNEPERLLISAKASFKEENFDEAFKFALRAKKEAEALVGALDSDGKKGISDLSVGGSEKGDELVVCCICNEKKIPYISIELDGGVEATCEECYKKEKGIEPTKKEEPVSTSEPKPKEEEKVEKEEKDEKKEKEDLKCESCGASIKEDDVFCGKCGKNVAKELKCHGCGTPVEPGDVFCRKCGARLSGN